jgi:hypothetical protein
MARSYGQIKVDIWRNPDFLECSPQAQRLYLYLTTQPKLSFAGVLSWRPRFAATASRGLTAGDVEEASDELAQASFIVIDEHTEELLVRSFVRHDEILKSPNMTKAMVSDWKAIDSETLRGVVAFEVQRLAAESPSLNGLKHAAELIEAPSVNPSENPSARGSGTLQEGDAEQTQTQTHQQTHSQRAEAQAAIAAEFDQWYADYPKKVAKPEAKKAFIKARKTVDLETLLNGLGKYKAAVNGKERQFIANPATWLNAGRWEDDYETETQPAHNALWDS